MLGVKKISSFLNNIFNNKMNKHVESLPKVDWTSILLFITVQ